MDAHQALAALWDRAGMPAAALDAIDLRGDEAVLPSSFDIATAAQASLGAAALAAAELGYDRSGGGARRQHLRVVREAAVLESAGRFEVDGTKPQVWDQLSGAYACGADTELPGHVRIHANFAHHRDGALRLLGLPPGDATGRDAVTQALRRWRAEDFETAAAQAGLVVSAVRSFERWDVHPQALAVAAQPTVGIERIGDAAPIAWPALRPGDRPLAGLKVLDLTRILAGPVGGRTLAAYGADVMLINSPKLPNIESIADTSRGKLSALLDLHSDAGRATLERLLQSAHVFSQGYRPGGLAGLGFGPDELARLRPGIVVVSLSAYGPQGPWSTRRGFDSLVQAASGFNVAEAQAAGTTGPKALPLQMLDYGAGYLMAFGAQVALRRQAREGGSWHVQVSLAGVGAWLRSLGRVPWPIAPPEPAWDRWFATEASGFGELWCARHAAEFSLTPAGWSRPSMPPGSHPPAWPARPG